MGFVVIHNIDECSGQRQSNCHYTAVYIAGTGKKAKAHLVFYIPTGITNLIGGFLAYFGLMAFVGSLSLIHISLCHWLQQGGCGCQQG